MAELVRRAGRGRLGADTVTWTVADGRRGRRWREVVVARDGGVRHALLFETSPDGRFAHLELATPHGLLTLHPEGDGTLHGNAVRADGVHHIEGLPWAADGVVVLSGSPVSAAACVLAFRSSESAAAGTARGVRIDAELGVVPMHAAVERVGERHWRLAGDEDLRAGPDHLPVVEQGQHWPLEG